MKRYLHLGSLTGVKLDEGLKIYDERKVKEGRINQRLNATRNKLLTKVFAVVDRWKL